MGRCQRWRFLERQAFGKGKCPGSKYPGTARPVSSRDRLAIFRIASLAVLAARRCVFAVVVCPSVRPSVRHKPVLYRNGWTSRAGFGHRRFLPPIPHYKEIWKTSKTRVLPSGTLSEFSTYKKFRHDKSIEMSTKLVVVVDGQAC